MATLTSSQFERCFTDNHSCLILDDHWSLTLEKYAEANSFILPYVSSPDWSDITIYVAGKNDGPNNNSLNTANLVFGNLEHHLAEIGKKYNPDDQAWIFTAIFAPYQFVDICYLQYWSAYGVDIECAVKLSDCNFGPAGILHLDETDNINIAWLPILVNYALSELAIIETVDQESIQTINDAIHDGEIMGPEIFDPLNDLVTIHYQSMSDPDKIIGQFRAAANMLSSAG